MKHSRSHPPARLDWKTIPWHVLFFSIYPILALLAHNITEAAPGMALAPLLLSILAATLGLIVLWTFLRDWQRAALVITVLLILFFSYGHVYSYLKGMDISGFYLFRHRTLAPAWLLLAALGTWWAISRHSHAGRWTLALNLVGLVLVVMPLAQIGFGLWTQAQAWRKAGQVQPVVTLQQDTLVVQESSPDIYYIILDAYGREDVINRYLDYDITPFLQNLEEQGFYVAHCSQSNYAQTELSLASSLNFNYLDALDESFKPGNTDRSPLWPLIRRSAIRGFLESRGYKSVAFATGYGWSEVGDADIYLKPPTGALELNSFQYMLVQTTAGRILLDAQELRLPNTPDDLIRRRTLFDLEKLRSLKSIQGPKFIFAHLLVPHSFVFGPNGEPIAVDISTMTPEIFKEGYVKQLMYIDNQIQDLVREIIANSSTPPIIILQGDHGPTGLGHAARVSILNAYYLPGHENELYPTISPVNTFRVVLNSYFGQHLELLPDIGRYSTYQDAFNYEEIDNICPQK